MCVFLAYERKFTKVIVSPVLGLAFAICSLVDRLLAILLPKLMFAIISFYEMLWEMPKLLEMSL